MLKLLSNQLTTNYLLICKVQTGEKKRAGITKETEAPLLLRHCPMLHYSTKRNLVGHRS